MQYFESNPYRANGNRPNVPSTVKAGQPIWVELTQGERVIARSPASDCAGEIAVDAMGYPGAGVQQITVPANGVASLGPVVDRDIVKVSATAGYIQVSVT
ncbi:hypothetical protein RAD16_27640 [Bradyrhizobium sp. 18BD]